MVSSVALLSLSSLAAAAVVPHDATIARRNVLSPLPSSATDIEKRFQPVMDFDTDGCYNTAAIDASGNTNSGLDSVFKCPADDCHNRDRLDNNNVYSRKRCNNGWCAIMYVNDVKISCSLSDRNPADSTQKGTSTTSRRIWPSAAHSSVATATIGRTLSSSSRTTR